LGPFFIPASASHHLGSLGKSGVKRSTLTDAAGVPLAIVAASANRHDVRHDVTLVAENLWELEISPPPQRKARPRLCMGLGYDSHSARQCARLMLWEPCLPPRRGPSPGRRCLLPACTGRTPRWGVERPHSCLNRFRRLLMRWEKREDTYLAMLHHSCGLITRRTALSK
jgi:hypothetical protein